MHLHTYRDESRSRHLDLIGKGWSIVAGGATSTGLHSSSAPTHSRSAGRRAARWARACEQPVRMPQQSATRFALVIKLKTREGPAQRRDRKEKNATRS